ncbi:MAG: hypothetical protein AAGF31_07225, partial [Planctomycetota bacterium]
AVPLGIANGILAGRPTVDGKRASDQPVIYDPERGGFVAWLSGTTSERRIVELKMLLPLKRDNLQTVLQTNLARANQATLVLDSSEPVTDAYASTGAILDVADNALGGTRLTAQGAVGDFQLGWRSPTTDQFAARTAVLSVEGQILSEVDGTNVRSRAKLTIDSYGQEIERFRVRLPAGSTLIPTATDGASGGQPRITLLPPERDALGRSRPVCSVTLAKPTSAGVSVVLETEQTVGLGDEAEIDLGGFEVIGAARQYGEVALRMADDWRLRWGELQSAQRIDVASLDKELRQLGVAAGLKYFGQPWQARVRIIRLGTRVEASPRYRLEIKPTEASLTTEVDYRIPGARVSSFSIDLRDWTSEVSLLPSADSELIDPDFKRQTQDGELYLPLLRPTAQQVTLRFSARLELPPRDQTLQLRLPIAKATSQSASELIVVVDPAVQLVPDLQQSRRLRPATLAAEDRDPADPSGLRTFRFVGFLPDQEFVAEKRLRPGELDVAVQTELRVSESTSVVEQTFDYDARYEPVTRIRIAAPAELAEPDAISFTLLPVMELESADVATQGTDVIRPDAASSGVPLNAELVTAPSAESQRAEWIVELPRPWIGPFCLRADYQMGEQRSREIAGGGFTIPLLSPLATPQRSHTLLASTNSGEQLLLAKEQSDWTPVADNNRTDSVLRVAASRVASSIALARKPEETSVADEAVLRRRWLQTWVGSDKVQQRIAFQFESQDAQATVKLPTTVGSQPIEVVLDGAVVTSFVRQAGQLIVPLPKRPDSLHTLEIRYFETNRPSGGSNSQPAAEVLAWQPARLIADAVLSESYWEIIVPSTRHVLDLPAGFVPAMEWSVQAGVWGRRSVLSTAALEEWIGAVERGRPAGAEHRYLYSCLGEIADKPMPTVTTASRSTLVVGSSAVVLAIGVALVYIPWLRRADCLFVLTLFGTALGMLYPGPFLFVVQAGILGLLLAGLTAVLSVLLRRPGIADLSTGPSNLTGQSAGPGTDTLISLPMGTVSTNAPTASLPPADSRGQ